MLYLTRFLVHPAGGPRSSGLMDLGPPGWWTWSPGLVDLVLRAVFGDVLGLFWGVFWGVVWECFGSVLWGWGCSGAHL